MATLNRELACLKHMFSMAIAWKKAEINPVKGVKFFKEENITQKILSNEEIKALLAACRSQDLKDVVQITLNTGMRRSEILQLKWEQVNIEQGYITVIKTKSGKQRIVPMNRTARNVLINRPKNGIFIFCGVDNPNGAVRSGFDLVVKRAGLGRCRFHDLRHTFATKLVLSGVSLPVVKELLGHESITTTMRYAHPTPDSKRQAVEMLESQTAVSSRHYMDTSAIDVETKLSVARCD